MEFSVAGKPERVGPVTVDDIRRDLLNDFTVLPAQVCLSRENLQVYLRVRPFTSSESVDETLQECVSVEGDTVVLKAPRSERSEKSLPQTAQRFTFTQVFGPESSQRKVFEGSVRGLVRDVLGGGNCLVFTYGVTNAGKTFTFLGPDNDSGLLPRSLSVIFNSIDGRVYSQSDLKPQRCRDYTRLTPDQQVLENTSKKTLLRLVKEGDRGLSTFLEGSSLSSDSSVNSVSEADSFCLDVDSNIRFSVWVSFCEIYNDNIHDLLEQVPSGNPRRTVLRLSQDVKGNSFVKDLRWVQVNSLEEAYKVMKIGKKNQSFSSTRLNQLSSRSHSIFSVRILRVEDVGVPRVLGISELAMCDLAGSERCSRTQNIGVRLKEAGNINSSLFALGKCISAMRLNQHARSQHHIPFRESKLTHFFQFFFCGAGRVSMVVNINQNSSNFDETLNVLKFSALAQKVVVWNSRPTVPDVPVCRSAREVSMIINEADSRRNVRGRSRESSLIAWETSLEDVQEDEDDEEDEGDEEDDDLEEEEEEESVMEGTVLEAGGDEEEEKTAREEDWSDREAELRLLLETQIREEVSSEFMEVINKMEKDYNDRLEKEREILEERAEKRLEILKNLVNKTCLPGISPDETEEDKASLLEGIIASMTQDLEKIREDAHTVQHCLTEHTHTAELEALRLEKQQSHDQLQAAEQTVEQQRQKLCDLMEMCQQKDDIITTLQSAMDSTMEDATKDRVLVESIRKELMELQQNCRCLKTGGEKEEKDSRKRRGDALEEEGGAPATKRAVLEEEIWRLQEENDKKEETISQLRGEREQRSRLEEELRRREEEVEELKTEQVSLEQKVEKLTGKGECLDCDSLLSSLESEQRETTKLAKENKALINGMFQLQTEVTSLQTQLRAQSDRTNNLSEQLDTTKARLQNQESQSEEKAKAIDSLTQEVTRLSQEADGLRQEVQEEEQQKSSVFHAAMEELRKESQAALERSALKSQEIENLQRDITQLNKTLMDRESECVQLREELANQKAEFSRQLQSAQTERDLLVQLGASEESCARRTELEKQLAESEAQHGALRERLEELERGVSRCGRRIAGPEQEVHSSPLQSNMADQKKTPRPTKRKSSDMEGLEHSKNKRNRVRTRANRQASVVKEKKDGTLQKIGDLIHSSPSILGSKAKTLIGLVSGRSVEKEAVTVATQAKPRRGRRKLYKMDNTCPLADSPNVMTGGAEVEKESDHLIIRRQLRSKTSRK
ncbi:uncharacterized protein kif20bb [Diretmus argenteus]